MKQRTFVQKTTLARLSKENLFCSNNNTPEIQIFNPWRHQKKLLVANQLQVSTFLFEINSQDNGISKLVSHLKLLSSMLELTDNDKIVLSTIIKKLQDMSGNRSFLISEVGKVVRLLLLSQGTNAESDGIFFALKRVKTYLWSTIGNNRLHDLILVHVHNNILHNIKGALLGLRLFLAIESPLKIMKNAFYFTLKALFVLKIFKFLSWLFGHVAKRLDQKDKVNFEFYDVTAWLINNYNTHIDQYLEK